MPKIPYAPYQGQLDANAPALQASPEAFAAPSQALARGGQQIQHTALDILTVQRALSAEQAKLDVDEKLSQLKVSYAEGLARMQAEGVHGKDYAGRADDVFATAARTHERTLLYPEAIGLWRRKSTLLGNELRIKAINDGVHLQNGEVLGAATLALEEKANGAVYGATAVERQRAYAEGLDITRSLLARRIVDGPAFAAMLKGYQADVQEGDARLSYQDPALRPRVRELLQTGGYNHLGPVKAATLLDTLDTRFLAAVRANDESRRRAQEEGKQTAMSDLAAQIADPNQPRDLLLVKLEGVRSTWGMHDTEFTRHYNAITAEREAPEDEAVRDRLTAAAHSAIPKTTEAELNAAQRAGQINYKRWVSLTDKLVSNERSARDEVRTVRKDRQAQAEQTLQAALGIPTLYERLDQRTKLLWGQAVQELSARSELYVREGRGEDPMAVIKEMIPRYAGALDVTNEDILKALVPTLKYRTPAELEEAHKAGAITPGLYDSQRILLLRLREVQNRKEQATQNQIFSAPGTKAR